MAKLSTPVTKKPTVLKPVLRDLINALTGKVGKK